jgi:adenosylcobinamide-GDP ribazoletransferase
MPTSFLIALKFLTTIPVYFSVPPDGRDEGASLNWYGFVGLAIGVVLAAAAWLLGGFLATTVVAALLLAIWVLLTGARHLDGLGDCADAYMGSSRARALEIMNDSRCGPIAVTAVVLVLLVKFAALVALLLEGEWVPLLVAPMLARASVQALLLTTPYVREGSAGSSLLAYMDRNMLTIMLTLALLTGAILMGASALFVLPIALLVFAGLRYLMMRRLLGATGDSAGAMVEILEATLLALMA